MINSKLSATVYLEYFQEIILLDQIFSYNGVHNGVSSYNGVPMLDIIGGCGRSSIVPLAGILPHGRFVKFYFVLNKLNKLSHIV